MLKVIGDQIELGPIGACKCGFWFGVGVHVHVQGRDKREGLNACFIISVTKFRPFLLYEDGQQTTKKKKKHGSFAPL